MDFPENSKLSPVEWIRVTVVEDATVYHDATIGVPRGLPDDEVTDFLLTDRCQEQLYKDENRTIEYHHTSDFDWLREGKIG